MFKNFQLITILSMASQVFLTVFCFEMANNMRQAATTKHELNSHEAGKNFVLKFSINYHYKHGESGNFKGVLFYVEMANNMRQAATTKHEFNRSV